MLPLPEARQQLLHLVVGKGLSVAPVHVPGLHMLQAQLRAPVTAVLGATLLCQTALTWSWQFQSDVFDKIETELRIVISNRDTTELALEKTQGMNEREREEEGERKRDIRYL